MPAAATENVVDPVELNYCWYDAALQQHRAVMSGATIYCCDGGRQVYPLPMHDALN
jgi:hypothetical protein